MVDKKNHCVLSFVLCPVLMPFCSFQPESLLASVLAHPILTASGLQGRDNRFIPPSTAATAAASVLASFSTSHLAHPSRGRSHGLMPTSVPPESTMYRSDRTVTDRYFPLMTNAHIAVFISVVNNMLNSYEKDFNLFLPPFFSTCSFQYD